MKNYKNWVKEEGQRFIDKTVAEYEKDEGKYGGSTGESDFIAWVDEHDKLIAHASEVGEGWGLADVNFVNSNSPNKEKQAVSRNQAIDAFVRDLSRVVKQLWKKRPTP